MNDAIAGTLAVVGAIILAGWLAETIGRDMRARGRRRRLRH